MDCARWNEAIVGRLYQENSAEDDAALDRHLAECASCRTTLDEMSGVRKALAEGEPAVPRPPRVVVLGRRTAWRPAAMAASILGAALLAGAGAGAGYAIVSARATDPAPVPLATTAKPGTVDDATAALIKDEVARRVAAIEANQAKTAPPAATAAGSVSEAQLRTELARLERKMNDSRAADVGYLLNEMEASETRIGTRLGKTNEAIKNVALASNPYAGAR